MRAAALPALAWLLAACGGMPGAPAATSSATGALRGGDADAGQAYPQVFLVRMRFDNGAQFACSATRVTPRTLLLAAHCFDPGGAGATALAGAWATNLSPGPPSTDPRWIPLERTLQHPAWRRSSPAVDDLALALLPLDAGVPLELSVSPVQRAPLTDADVGQPLEVVGYGVTAPGGADAGTRRSAVLPLAKLTAQHLELGDRSGTGLCNGDSGGPSLLRGPDGVLRVAGVHSYDSSLQCNYGQDARVDLYGDFIRQWLLDTEGPTCVEDGLCLEGCAPADPDCPRALPRLDDASGPAAPGGCGAAPGPVPLAALLGLLAARPVRRRALRRKGGRA